MISRVIMLIISMLTLLVLFVWSGELAILGFSVILLSLFLLGIIINIITVRAINYDVELNNDTSGTQCLTLKINVSNKSIFPVFIGKVKLRVENMSFKDVSRREHFFFSIGGKEEKTVCYDVECDYCGKFIIELEAIRIYDFWGIVSKNICKDNKRLAYMYPKYYHVKSVSQVMKTNYEKERYFSHRKGDNLSEILQYKEYRPGDNVKLINWKLSNKLGKLFIREFDTPTDNQTLVTFDAYGENRVTKNIVYSVLVSICYSYVKSKIPHQFGYYDSNDNKLDLKEVESSKAVFDVVRRVLDGTKSGNQLSMQLLLKNGVVDKYAKVVYITNSMPDSLRKDLKVKSNVKVIMIDEAFYQGNDLEKTIMAMNI